MVIESFHAYEQMGGAYFIVVLTVAILIKSRYNSGLVP
jgi:hypothetical protein